MIILDTNVVSALMELVPNVKVVSWLDRQPRISIWITSITMLEIQRGVMTLPGGRKRLRLGSEFEELISGRFDGRIASFDQAAASATAALIVSREKKGKNYDLEDGMLAGIVLSRHATIATRNTRHFDDLSCNILSPWSD